MVLSPEAKQETPDVLLPPGCQQRSSKLDAMDFEGKEFVGKWKTYKDVNFDGFLSSMGVPWLIRKTIAATKPMLEITYARGEFTYSTQAFTTYTIKFKMGEEFEETAQGPSGEKFKAIITYEDGKMIHKQLKDDPCEYIREVKGGELILTCKHKDAVCFRHCKRVA